MLNKVLAFLIILTMTQPSCRRSNQQSNQAQPSPQKPVETPIDTAAVFQVLSFNATDSGFIYAPSPNSGFFDDTISFYLRSVISPQLSPFDIRAVLSTRPGDLVSHFGSFVIIYKPVDSISINRIRQDSIDISVGNLSMMGPEMNILDFNYDGYKDIVLSFTENTTGRAGYSLFLAFDPATRQFVPESTLNSLFYSQEIYINVSNRTISDGGRIGIAGFSGVDYRWDGTTYAPFARYGDELSDDGNATISTKEEIRSGEWVIVSRDTIPIR